MKKLLLIVLVAGIIYSVAWVALAQLGEQKLSQAIKTESVSVTGFPQGFTAKFKKPEITVGNAVLSSNESLEVSRDIAGSEYHFVLPRNITIRSKQTVLNCHFAKPAALVISVEPLGLEKQQYHTLQSLLKDPKFYAAFRLAEYKDAGAVCTNAKYKSRYTYTNSAFSVRNEKRENNSVLYYKGVMTGDLNIALDVQLDGYDPFLTKAFPENSQLLINTLRFQSARYAGDLSGYIKINKTDIFPYGLVKLNLQNITPMLNDLYTAPVQKLPEQAKLKMLLLKLANAKAGDENLVIPIARPQSEDLQIGSMRLAEFLGNWYALFANNDNSRAQ